MQAILFDIKNNVKFIFQQIYVPIEFTLKLSYSILWLPLIHYLSSDPTQKPNSFLLKIECVAAQVLKLGLGPILLPHPNYKFQTLCKIKF